MLSIRSIRNSFSAKLSLYILFMAVPIFVVSIGMFFCQSRDYIRGEAVERANGALNATTQRMRRYLVTAETATNTYSWVVEQSMQSETLKRITEQIVRMNPDIDGCAISTEPNVLSDYPDFFTSYTIRDKNLITTTIEHNYDYFSQRWYQMPREQKKASWVVYYDDKNVLNLNLNGKIATYSKPLLAPDSTLLGVISTEMSLLHLSKVLGCEKPYPNSYFVIVDEEGRYIAHPDSTLLFNETLFSVTDAQKQADLIALAYEMTQGKKGQMFANVHGVSSLVCYKPIPNTTWSLAIVCPESDILKGLRRLSYIVVTLLVVGLFIIILNCHKAISFSIHPLHKLLKDTKNISEGNMKMDIPRTSRRDAVGDLQNSFSMMLESLNYYIDSVRTASASAQRYNDELEQATKLVMEADRQKTTFIHNVTHQVRTPLNIITGFAQILNTPANAATPSTEGTSAVDIEGIKRTMKHNTKLLIRMVLMLFDSSDSGSAEIEKCNKREMMSCNEAVRYAIAYTNQIDENIHIDFETDVPDDFCIYTNQKYLVYSLQEVLNNAIRYSDGQHISVKVTRTDSTIRFIMQDTGKGIAETELDNIFKFFTKVDDFSEGLGLGLPLAKRHANNLGGDFWLDTDYKEGCRFIFEFKLSALEEK